MQPHTSAAVAPARVNLIGEHTDYTGGLVLPMAIPFFTRATIGTAADGRYRFLSDQFSTERTMELGDRGGALGEWSDYPVGVLRQLQRAGYQPAPMRLRLSGDVPLGSGLSSSASVEVATAFALLAHLGTTLPPREIALLCQRAENEYVGAPCGIMDQTVIVLAEEHHALLLNTRTLEYEAVATDRGTMGETSVVVCNSLVRHSVAGGAYGDRRREVEAGQATLLARKPALRDLGEAALPDLQEIRAEITGDSFRRCRHIITENARVRSMREALLEGNARAAGELMLAAHASQRDDFACSVPEIDFLVETAAALPGCYGGRMTGGGFGGCTVNLVRTEAVARFTSELKAAYLRRFWVSPDVFVCKAVDGALLRQGKEAAAK